MQEKVCKLLVSESKLESKMEFKALTQCSRESEFWDQDQIIIFIKRLKWPTSRNFFPKYI